MFRKGIDTKRKIEYFEKKLVKSQCCPIWRCVVVHRITNGNSSAADKRRLRVPEKPSRAYALCAFFFHHSFVFARNATHFLYRKHKTVSYLERYTTRGLVWRYRKY